MTNQCALLNSFLLVAAGSFGALMPFEGAIAQNVVIPDNTLGLESSRVDNLDAATDRIGGGAARDTNLFHSFSEFNVGDGLRVYFDNPTGIENIFSRVTGSNASNILGTLGVEGAANLFFLNPNGIIFGKNASLDVAGSFSATTADSFLFSDGSEFNAINPAGNSLLTVSVPLGLQVGAIAPTSTIENAGTLAAGEDLSLATGQLRSQGMISAGESLRVTANSLFVTNGARLRAGASNSGKASDAIVNIAGTASFEGISRENNESGGIYSGLQSNETGIGGNIRITAENLKLMKGAQISSEGFGNGDAGDVIISASEGVLLDGRGSTTTTDTSGIFSSVSAGIGTSGDILITADNLIVSNGAQLNSANAGAGGSGNIVVEATNTVRFEGVSPATGRRSGATSDARPVVDGLSGNLSVRANNIEVVAGARLAADSFATGDAGKVTLEAQTIRIDGFDETTGQNSLISSSIRTDNGGSGGSVAIRADELAVLNGGEIATDTFSSGSAGSIDIDIQDRTILNGSRTFLNGDGELINLPSAISSSVLLNAEGKGADISIRTGALEVSQGAQIGASVFRKGNAGSVLIEVAGTARFLGVNSVTGAPSGISGSIIPGSEGTGGVIQINANDLEVLDGARLSSVNGGIGKAGDVVINTTQTARFEGTNPQTGDFSGVSTDVRPGASGTGGDIHITADDLTLSNGAQLNASNNGTGNAGNITLNIREQILANDGTIQTRSLSASGGRITVEAGSIQLLGNSDIETFVSQGDGRGGDITAIADTIIALDDSDVLAFSQDGEGGNILVDAPAFFAENYRAILQRDRPENLDGNSRVDINASGAVSGKISVPEANPIQEELAQLPDDVADAQTLIAGSCVGGDRQPSSFIISGGNTLSVRPGETPISPYALIEVQPIPDEGIAANNNSGSSRIVEPEGIFKLPDGRLLLGRTCRQEAT